MEGALVGAARNGCKTLPWQVRVLVDSGWVVDRDGGWIMQMGWLLDGLLDVITELKEIAAHAFDSPTRQKEGDLTTHILNDITDFWDICMLNAYGFQIRNNIFTFFLKCFFSSFFCNFFWK